MATRFFGVDGGGTTRLFKKVYAVDGGGVTRRIKRAFVIDSGGVARRFYVSQHDFSIVAGQRVGTTGAPEDTTPTATGYSEQNYIFGSISNSTDPNGRIIREFYDEVTAFSGAPERSIFSIKNFPSDPGQNYFVSVTANGITRTSATAGYGWNSFVSTATWIWTGLIFGFGNGGTYPSIISF